MTHQIITNGEVTVQLPDPTAADLKSNYQISIDSHKDYDIQVIISFDRRATIKKGTNKRCVFQVYREPKVDYDGILVEIVKWEFWEIRSIEEKE
jgi:hypothetical protein